jgi:hypothetical protein
VPRRLLPEGWQARVRETDVWDETDDAVTVLCRGADTQTVRHLLARLGITADEADRAGTSITVARTTDLLRLRPVPQVERV